MQIVPESHGKYYPISAGPNLVLIRFLGLGRVHWLDEQEKTDLLIYVLERYPPYFIPFMPIRFHEHPDLRTLDTAKELVDANVVPGEWEKMAGMVLEKQEPVCRDQ
ncbi:hypothetical protein ACFL4G_09080 [Thermodesulfobacteriota bacterium]